MAKTESGIREIHESVLRMRKIRKQISEVVELLADRPEMREVVDSGKKIDANY
jgi:hypothetical protein